MNVKEVEVERRCQHEYFRDKEHNVQLCELEDIKNSSDKMAPEDRVARTMDLQEDIAAKVEVIKKNAETELALLPQGKSCFLFTFTINAMFVSKSYFSFF